MMHKRLSCVLSGLRFCMCEYWIYGTNTHMNHTSRDIFSFWLVLISVYNKNCSICCYSSLPSGFLCSLKNPIQIFKAEFFLTLSISWSCRKGAKLFSPHTSKNGFQLNYSAEKRKSWLAWMTEIEVKVELFRKSQTFRKESSESIFEFYSKLCINPICPLLLLMLFGFVYFFLEMANSISLEIVQTSQQA